MIKIYTDGSCIGNPGKGGRAAIIIDDGKKTIDSFKSLLDENLVSADDAYIDPLGKSYYNLYDS